jgi:hypothetical protein
MSLKMQKIDKPWSFDLLPMCLVRHIMSFVPIGLSEYHSRTIGQVMPWFYEGCDKGHDPIGTLRGIAQEGKFYIHPTDSIIISGWADDKRFFGQPRNDHMRVVWHGDLIGIYDDYMQEQCVYQWATRTVCYHRLRISRIYNFQAKYCVWTIPVAVTHSTCCDNTTIAVIPTDDRAIPTGLKMKPFPTE